MTSTNNSKLERANKVTINSTDNGYRADFYRTHKKLATLFSEETEWTADESMNKSAQREDFRKYAIEHAEAVGVYWDPADKRVDTNKRIPKYENDELLREDAHNLLWCTLFDLNESTGFGLEFGTLTADTITPMLKSPKGADLSKLGIIDGKYERSGNWAWAEIEMTLTLTKDGQEIYYTTTAQLVSGQLKKPHITKTSFTESVRESLKEAGLWTEEAKEEKSSEAETPEVKEEEKKESKAKTTKTKKSKAKDTEAEQADK